MLVRPWVWVFVVVAAAACGTPAKQGSAPPGKAVARCGSDGPAGFDIVLAGTDNQFFTARNRQSLRIKPDVEVKTKVDEKGNVRGLTMVARDNSVNVSCDCPAGCSSDPGPGHGCVVQYPPGGQDASCTGDCVAENTCCSGCGFMAPH
jgi:hypothetical protein